MEKSNSAASKIANAANSAVDELALQEEELRALDEELSK